MRLHLRRRRHRRSSCNSSRARGREPPPPIAETAAYDWSPDSSCFNQRHLILSGLRGGQTIKTWEFLRELEGCTRCRVCFKSQRKRSAYLIQQQEIDGALLRITQLRGKANLNSLTESPEVCATIPTSFPLSFNFTDEGHPSTHRRDAATVRAQESSSRSQKYFQRWDSRKWIYPSRHTLLSLNLRLFFYILAY